MLWPVIAKCRLNPGSMPKHTLASLITWYTAMREASTDQAHLNIMPKQRESAMRKLILVISVILLICIMLAGCGGEEPTPAAEAESGTCLQSLAAPAAPEPVSSSSTLSDSPTAVKVYKDLVYAIGTKLGRSFRWRLDVYAPGEAGEWPAVLLLPGAGQRKGEYEALPRAIAEEGAIVFVADYPNMHPRVAIVSKGKGLREMAETVACALRCARARAPDFGSDSPTVAISGFAVGAGIGSHAALLGENVDSRWEEYAESRGGPRRQVECLISEGSTGVDVLVGVAGAYDSFMGLDGEFGRDFIQEKDRELWEMLNGTIGGNPDLKVRLLHSETDDVIPIEISGAFEEILADEGYDVELIPFEGGHSSPLEETVQTIIDVLGD